MHSSNNNNDQQQRSIVKMDEHQALLALQHLGMGWPVQSLLQNIGREQQQQPENDLIKQLLKAHTQQTNNYSTENQQQKYERELFQKRPSLIHDFGGNMAQGARYSLIQPHLQQAQMNQSSSGIGVASSEISFLTDEEETEKRKLNEKLEKINRDRTQATTMKNNAEKKAKACEKLIAKASQEPMAGMGENEEDDEDKDSLSPTEALIERIYAENKRKAAATTLQIPPSPNNQLPTTNRDLMAEDAARLAREYQQGLQFLPSLVRAMRIQRERRQDALESRRIIYEEQLTAWEKKVVAHEKNPKKLARDVKHRELFEKTFVELKKMREEKERNNRVERTRFFSLAQGGNGIGTSVNSSAMLLGQMQQQPAEDFQTEERLINDSKMEPEVDEKVCSAAIIPPVYSNPPRRFFENRNGFVENALAETRAQTELFQSAWTDAEKTVFSEKTAIYGKNFAAIAAFLPAKSVKDAVQFYYMTKKRNNYKQKFARRRKKLGRQGYRPPIMPRFGDTDENFHNYSKGCTFVECLLCDSRILVLESLAQQTSLQAQHFDFDDFSKSDVHSGQLPQQEMPICTKCQNQAQRNKTLNRCPLGICICVAGKRKMKPARNIPEKFANLGVDHKRFLINRLKMPPSSNKCCTNCFKRISKEIDELLLGDFQSELESFKQKYKAQKLQQKPTLITDGFEEEEDGIEAKGPSAMSSGRALEEGEAPLKELKLEAAESAEIKKEMEDAGDEAAAKKPSSSQGSITRGTPNRTRNSILGSIGDANEQMPIKEPSPLGIQQPQQNFEDFSQLLAQLGINQTNVHSKEAAAELNRQLSGMLGSFQQHEWMNSLQLQIQQLQQQQQQIVDKSPGPTASQEPPILSVAVPDSNDVEQQQQRRDSESLRRKSGLATALLPSPVPDSPAGPSRLTTANSRAAFSPTATTIRPSEFVERGEKLLLEQRDSNLTTHSNDTAVTKTESTQGQLSSCYESLSDDSDEEKAAKKEQKTTPKLPPNSAPPATFFSVFDLFEDDPATAEGSLAPMDISVPEESNSQMKSTFNCLPPMTNAAGTESRTVTEVAGSKRSPTTDCVYEPLSSDEET